MIGRGLNTPCLSSKKNTKENIKVHTPYRFSLRMYCSGVSRTLPNNYDEVFFAKTAAKIGKLCKKKASFIIDV